MPVVDVKVTSREPYDTGVAGGSAYERLDGSLTFAVDPHSPANAPITDLGLAPTDEDGRVRFTSDFCLLHSTEPSEIGRALVDIVNRGRKISVTAFNIGASGAVQRDSPPGDGFLFAHGFAVLSLGWQWVSLQRDTSVCRAHHGGWFRTTN